MTADEERIIIKNVLSGDRNAFEGLVVANQKNVYNLAMKMVGCEDDALDISQESFLKAYRDLSGFRAESRFSVWLYRLTYNLCVDFLRKKKRNATVPLSYQDDSGEVHDLEIPDMRNLPENNALRKETRKTIVESIAKLDLHHREILVMREITHMSYQDMAVALDISEGTVKSRLARARKALSIILIKKGTFPESYRQNDQRVNIKNTKEAE
ncbi:MAG: sigma-70 family RNA polymerase sigma factor [Oscillospiraceae bacterium]|nr:sigma-70 family RNA polymerase sigma factor [Oscillospiraceae bacterium]